jgi:hypothetical protein
MVNLWQNILGSYVLLAGCVCCVCVYILIYENGNQFKKEEQSEQKMGATTLFNLSKSNMKGKNNPHESLLCKHTWRACMTQNGSSHGKRDKK